MRLLNTILQLSFLLLLQTIATSSAPAKFSLGRILGKTARGVKCAGHACFVEAPIRTTNAISDTASKALRGSDSLKAKFSKGLHNMREEINKPIARKENLEKELYERKAAKIAQQQQRLNKQSQKLESKRQSVSGQSSAGSAPQSATSQHLSHPSPQHGESSTHSNANSHVQHAPQRSTNSYNPQRSHSSRPQIVRSHSAGP